MLKKLRPTSPGSRHQLRRIKPVKVVKIKSLMAVKKNFSGRNNTGKITVRHRGGMHKRFLRLVDSKRTLLDVTGKVVQIEYDPNRTANIALIQYTNGAKAYILAPEGLKVDGQVISSKTAADIEVGNCLPLSMIPVGTPIHNLELTPGRGGQIVRSAGTAAYIQDKEGHMVGVKLPSGEIRRILDTCMATVGILSNPEHKNERIGKAGRKRNMGWRPTVRGVAQHPNSHPHGGGEGRSGIGMPGPKTPWGKPAMGVKTRDKKRYSNKHIINRRKAK